MFDIVNKLLSGFTASECLASMGGSTVSFRTDAGSEAGSVGQDTGGTGTPLEGPTQDHLVWFLSAPDTITSIRN